MTTSAEFAQDDPYLGTIKRMEPDIACVDHAAAMASIAISLKRIADALCELAYGDADSRIADKISAGVYNGIVGAEREKRR